MTEKKFNCRDQATDKKIDKTLNKLINEAKDKIRQKVVYSSYNEADRIMKKNEARFSKYFKELS